MTTKSHPTTAAATGMDEFHVGQEVRIEGKTPGVIEALLPDGMLLVRTAADLVPLPPVLLPRPAGSASSEGNEA